jgi:alpha-galactosidase
MTEIRYVEGHYQMWDDLLAQHPGLAIDNCASGGRRIDIETIRRSVPLWRSDTSCSPGHPEWNQAQSLGLSLYVPLQTACGWIPDPYDFRSAATGGAICQFDYLNPSFPMDLAKASIAEARENAKYWYGDFYPLTSATLASDQWAAYQLHRSDLNSGIVLVFRRGGSPYTGLNLALRGLDPKTMYEIELIDDARAKTTMTHTGEELTTAVELRIAKKGSSLLVRYRPARGR